MIVTSQDGKLYVQAKILIDNASTTEVMRGFAGSVTADIRIVGKNQKRSARITIASLADSTRKTEYFMRLSDPSSTVGPVSVVLYVNNGRNIGEGPVLNLFNTFAEVISKSPAVSDPRQY